MGEMGGSAGAGGRYRESMGMSRDEQYKEWYRKEHGRSFMATAIGWLFLLMVAIAFIGFISGAPTSSGGMGGW